ncbi:MAG: shikimate kinase [Mycobacteriales bacterium]
MAADKVLLIGMMGAGKSTVGAALGARLGWPYVDNDSMLQRTSGQTAPQLVESGGELALRQAESKVLTMMLALPGPLVGGVPGGVVLDDTDRTRLAAAPCHVVWLRATPAVLARRVGAGAGRPWLGDDPVAALRRLAAERNALYEQVADQVVDVDALPVGVIAKAILAAMEQIVP